MGFQRAIAPWRCPLIVLGAAVVVLLAGTGRVRAQVAGPYAPDAATLQLWHMNGDAENAVAGAANLAAQNGATLNNPAADPTLGTSAGNFTSASGSYVGAGAPVNSAAAGGTDNINIALQNAVTRAFTMEALVRLSSASITTNMQIISGEGEGNATQDRIFQFRIAPVGGVPRIEFNNFGGNLVFANLPTSGANVPNATDWFHVAVTYNGSPATADNMIFYWTRLDPANTAAAVLGTAQQSGNLPLDNNGASGGNTNTDFAIGNEVRATGGQTEPFLGLIDEVRISSTARAAGEFIVLVPEPSSALALAALAGPLLARRRRRADAAG